MARRTQNFGWPVPDNPDLATIPDDLLSLAIPIDAVVQQLADRVEAKEQIFVHHAGNGKWAISNGLGDPVPVSTDNQGTWQVIS